MCQSLTWQCALLSASLAVLGSIVVTWGLRNVPIFLHIAFLPHALLCPVIVLVWYIIPLLLWVQMNLSV